VRLRMKELVTIPMRLNINEQTVAFRVGEDDDCQFAASQYAKFMDFTCWIIDKENGEEFYTVVSTYSMN
jgi:hypothetical protein